MNLDNWLAQRAQTCPDRTALIADGRDLTYAELEAEATAAARRLAAHGVRARRDRRPSSCRAGADYVVLLHALMKLGAVAEPLNTRLAPTPSARPSSSAPQPVLDRLARPPTRARPEADLPLLGEHDLDALHCRILTSGTSGRARARSGSPTATTSGARSAPPSTSASTRPTAGSAACRCTTSAGLSIVMRSVIYGTGAVVARRLRRRARGATRWSVTGSPWSRSSPRSSTACSRPGSTSPGRARSWSAAARCRVEVLEEAIGRGATVVQTYGLTEAASQVTTLAPAGGATQARLGRAAAAHHAPADPGRRDPRPGPDRRARAAPTRTAGSTPATWAGSTTRASSTSRTASAT